MKVVTRTDLFSALKKMGKPEMGFIRKDWVVEAFDMMAFDLDKEEVERLKEKEANK